MAHGSQASKSRFASAFFADARIGADLSELARKKAQHTSSVNADKYYAQIRGKERKSFTKCHVAVDVDSRIILYSQATKGPKHDTKFAIAAIRSLKKYYVDYIIADKAYDTNKIRESLRSVRYRDAAAYGHFGRKDGNFTWERTDAIG